jgi:hypothetical protein
VKLTSQNWIFEYRDFFSVLNFALLFKFLKIVVIYADISIMRQFYHVFILFIIYLGCYAINGTTSENNAPLNVTRPSAVVNQIVDKSSTALILPQTVNISHPPSTLKQTANHLSLPAHIAQKPVNISHYLGVPKQTSSSTNITIAMKTVNAAQTLSKNKTTVVPTAVPTAAPTAPPTASPTAPIPYFPALPEDPNFKPIVYLHVGPPKTGTTHIQTYLMKHIRYLNSFKFCYPSAFLETEKAFRFLALDIHMNRNLSAHKALINKCVVKQMNIFISAENLAPLNETKLEVLKTLFPQGSTIYIIIAYREWLSRMYSHYTEEAKVNLYRAGPISSFLYEDYGNIVNSPLEYDMKHMVDRFVAVFGWNNTMIVDYHGVMSSRKDLVYVFLCEIVKVLCFKTRFMNTKTTHENKRPNEKYIHLIALLRDYVHFHGYRFCRIKIGEFSRTLLAYYNDLKPNPPVKVSHLTLLYPYSQALDEKFRNKYNTRLLYDNQTAAIMSMQKLEAVEINEREFYADPEWKKWLQKELERLLRNKKICLRVAVNSTASIE